MPVDVPTSNILKFWVYLHPHSLKYSLLKLNVGGVVRIWAKSIAPPNQAHWFPYTSNSGSPVSGSTSPSHGKSAVHILYSLYTGARSSNTKVLQNGGEMPGHGCSVRTQISYSPAWINGISIVKPSVFA